MNTTLKNSMNRLKQPIPKSLLIAGFFYMTGTSLFAADYTWNGALTGDLNNITLWTPTCPAIDFNNTYNIETPGANVTQAADTHLAQLMVGSASGAPAVLNITHRVANNAGTVGAGASFNFDNAKGTINHTAGLIDPLYNYTNSQWILVGCSTKHGNVGTYNFGGAPPGPSIVAPWALSAALRLEAVTITRASCRSAGTARSI